MDMLQEKTTFKMLKLNIIFSQGSLIMRDSIGNTCLVVSHTAGELREFVDILQTYPTVTVNL